MGTKKQPDGTWHAFYSKRHPVTKIPVSLRRRHIESEAEALRVENDLVLLVEERLKEVVLPRWGTLVEEYLEFCALDGMLQKTIYNRKKCLKAATSRWDSRFISAITANEIRSVVSVDYQDRSPSQRKSVLQYIRRVFDFACEKGYLQKNPTPRMAIRISEKMKGAMTEEQVRTFLNKAKALNSKWYTHYAVAVYTGMRSGELYALTWDKVDLQNRRIPTRMDSSQLSPATTGWLKLLTTLFLFCKS